MTIKHKHVHRIRITGPSSEWERAMEYCNRNGYRVVGSGPKPLKGHRIDVTKFNMTAEREE